MYKVIKDDYIVDLLEKVTYVKFLRGTTKRTITDITNADGFVGSDGKSIYVLQGKFSPVGYENNVVQLVAISEYEYNALKELRKVSNNILVNPKSLRAVREEKIHELSEQCKQHIFKGISVVLSDNFSHQFTLTIEDQLNIEGLLRQVSKGARYVLYHENGCISRIYTAEDMRKIDQAAFEYKQKHQLRFNCLKYCVNNIVDVDVIKNIEYDTDVLSLPVTDNIKHRLEVLLNE